MEAGGQNRAAVSTAFAFKLEDDWPSQHMFYIENLMSSGIAVSDILQIDLHGRRGFCSVTVSSLAVRDRVLSQGISVAGKPVQLTISGADVVSVHVFGCPHSLSDSAVATSFLKFGSVIGVPQRG